jgi:SAM-dependent methyltransferase
MRRGGPADYSFYAADVAAHHLQRIRGAEVMVAGCNTGGDCRLFVEMGAAAVHGIDVIEQVGSEYTHPRVTYSRSPVEELDLPANRFDLAFAHATFEHVPNIERGFAEMTRVTRPGGIVFSIAAPLWHSPFGHHKGDLFPDYPWIHLRLTKEQILAYASAANLPDPTGEGFEHHVDYMLNPEFFNMAPASRYVAACEALEHVELIQNEIDYHDDSILTPQIERELAERGLYREELLGSTHRLVARKIEPSPAP